MLLGCGGGSSTPQRETDGKAQMSCLQSRNIQATQNTDLAFGVSDTFFRYGAADPTDPHSKVDVYVFDDHDKALKNRPAITLKNEDDKRNQVVDRTLVNYSIVPGTSFSSAVSACVQGGAPSS
jgi:hypothetical protein